MTVCIFCLRHHERNPPGPTCTYGMHHEYPELPEVRAVMQSKKKDAQLCIHCGLHPKNPASSRSNGCTHEYTS